MVLMQLDVSLPALPHQACFEGVVDFHPSQATLWVTFADRGYRSTVHIQDED